MTNDHRADDIADPVAREARRFAELSLCELFERDASRAATLSGAAGPLFVDYSKQHIDADALAALRDFARQRQLAQRLNEIAQGAAVNNTEGRAACHNRLRTDGVVADDVGEMRAAMSRMVASFTKGDWPNTREPIKHIVNIGIGGSDLGPRMLVDALSGIFTPRLDVSFVANVDPANLRRVLRHCEPATTLFIVSSKSFGTEETLRNAAMARTWLEDTLPAAQASHHFVAVTANPAAAREQGYLDDHLLTFPSWVGGRFSVWSAIGLPVALAFGMDVFERFLAGGAAIDRYALSTDLDDNHVITLGLLDTWNSSFLDRDSLAVLPYDHNLRHLPDYLQQLMMESNGKSVTRAGQQVALSTCPVVWGSEGTNGQHSFHQLLHQGTREVTCDFLLPLRSTTPDREQHNALVAHCLSQSLVLMQGQSVDQVVQQLMATGLDEAAAQALARHKAMPGNRASTTICYEQTSPETIGALIALYEYRVMVAAILWDINPFDQWGVELGKKVSSSIAEAIGRRDTAGFDGSTTQLLDYFLSATDQKP